MKHRLTLAALLLPLCAGAQSEWTVASKPLLDLPGVGASGTVNFENIAGATRLANGSILIADRGPSLIRLFDATGKQIKTSGGRGNGPGEFTIMVTALRCGRDSLLIWDLPKSTASLVGGAGTVARQFRIPDSASAVAGIRRPLTTMACGGGNISYISDPTGRLAPSPETPNVFPMISALVTVDRNGHVLGKVDSIRSMEMVPMTSPTGGRGAMPRPLGLTPFVALQGEVAVLGLSDSAQLVRYGPLQAKKVMPVAIARRDANKDDIEQSITSISAMNPQLRQAIESQLATAPVPKVAPAFTAMGTDDRENVWLETSPAAGKQMLLVIRPDGQLAARVILPLPIMVTEVGADYVMGTYTDANDEPHLVVLGLSRR